MSMMHDDTPFDPDEITGSMEIGSFTGDDGRPKIIVTFAMDMRLFARGDAFLAAVITRAQESIDEGFKAVARHVEEQSDGDDHERD